MAATKPTSDPSIDRLFRARKGTVEFVDVPQLSFVVVDGTGSPEGPGFAAALQALYSVSYGAHFDVRKRLGVAPRVMPLEALWWIEGSGARAAMEALAEEGGAATADRESWRWSARIVQLAPIDAATIERAVETARQTGKGGDAIGDLHLLRWTEGPSAQVLHVGPYATEMATVALLHRAIADAGMVARGHHHEIYLGDPRCAAPEKLRTVLRQPVERPAP